MNKDDLRETNDGKSSRVEPVLYNMKDKLDTGSEAGMTGSVREWGKRSRESKNLSCRTHSASLRAGLIRHPGIM